MNLFSFGIIGGGWYGCHIATSLKALGFRVQLFEQHDRLLHEASGNNQFRLHLGFHYARHSGTRIQSRDGYSRFVERYPELSRTVPANVYAVPTRESLIDYDTYRVIMTSSGVHFTEGAPPGIELANIEGVMCTPERVLLLAKARAYFEAQLKGLMHLGHKVGRVDNQEGGITIDGERFDFAVDATWGHYSTPRIPVIYEPTLLLYYEGPPSFPAVTMVDGPLCSVYPTEAPDLFTLSSVPHTPLGQYAISAEARVARDSTSAATIAAKRALMESQIEHYLPRFRELFRFAGPQLAIKTKPIGAHDDRTCNVSRQGRLFSVMSGKIDTVFFATDRILAMIEAAQADAPEELASSLRADIESIRSRTGMVEPADGA